MGTAWGWGQAVHVADRQRADSALAVCDYTGHGTELWHAACERACPCHGCAAICLCASVRQSPLPPPPPPTALEQPRPFALGDAGPGVTLPAGVRTANGKHPPLSKLSLRDKTGVRHPPGARKPSTQASRCLCAQGPAQESSQNRTWEANHTQNSSHAKHKSGTMPSKWSQTLRRAAPCQHGG